MAGEAYTKRYAGGFADGSGGGTPVDSTFLNAVEAALLRLLGEDPAADEVGVWVPASNRFVFQKITNAQIDAAAAIDKSKLGPLNIVNADIAGAAAIAQSKLALAITDAQVAAGAGIALSKIAANASVVTALPGSPTNGQVVVLTDSLTAPTYAWTLVYLSGISDANKWIYLGGTPARAQVITDEAIGTSGVWKNLATNGPLFTVPRAGVYNVEYHVQTYSAGGVSNDFQVGPAIGDTTPTEFQRHNNPTGNAHYIPMSGTHQLACAASDIIKLRYVITGNVGAQFGRRYLRVTPFRIA